MELILHTLLPERGMFMGRAQGHKTRDRNKSSLPQVPKEMKMDRMSEEYAEELNNQISREEQALANAANQRNQGN
jgi:hypothetical protein